MRRLRAAGFGFGREGRGERAGWRRGRGARARRRLWQFRWQFQWQERRAHVHEGDPSAACGQGVRAAGPCQASQDQHRQVFRGSDGFLDFEEVPPPWKARGPVQAHLPALMQTGCSGRARKRTGFLAESAWLVCVPGGLYVAPHLMLIKGSSRSTLSICIIQYHSVFLFYPPHSQNVSM